VLKQNNIKKFVCFCDEKKKKKKKEKLMGRLKDLCSLTPRGQLLHSNPGQPTSDFKLHCDCSPKLQVVAMNLVLNV
jgi:hypothetical protein